jgi:hypothetical protein
MANFRCFNTYNSENLNASDYISYKKRSTLFKNAQTIAIGNSSYQKNSSINNISPGYHLKKTGGRYFGPVYINPNDVNITNKKGCLISANSYDILYDILKGYRVDTVDFDLNSVVSGLGFMWVGTFSLINYIEKNINCAVTNVPNGDCNVINYPSKQDYTPTYIKDLINYPGIIVDPNYEVFYPNCDTNITNYRKNVTFLFNQNTIIPPQVAAQKSLIGGNNIIAFPFPLNFNNTKCSIPPIEN